MLTRARLDSRRRHWRQYCMQREKRPAFNSNRLTALLQIERRLTDHSLMLFRYSYEDVRVTNPEEVSREARPAGEARPNFVILRF